MGEDTLAILKRLDSVMKRKMLMELIPASASTLSLWLAGKYPIPPRSCKAIEQVYEKVSGCLDKLEV